MRSAWEYRREARALFLSCLLQGKKSNGFLRASIEKGKMNMREFTYVITDKEGIHARPAGELVKLAKEYASSVSILKEGKKADAKKVFGLMGLGVKQGMEIAVQVEGDDEDAAAALEAFLKENL